MRPAFRKRRQFTSAHHHFFEIRETRAGEPYLVVDQSTLRGGDRSSQKIVIFQDEIRGFIALLEEFASAMRDRSYRDGDATTDDHQERQGQAAVVEDYDEEDYLDDKDDYVYQGWGTWAGPGETSTWSNTPTWADKRSIQFGSSFSEQFVYFISGVLRREYTDRYDALWNRANQDQGELDRSDRARRTRMVEFLQQEEPELFNEIKGRFR